MRLSYIPTVLLTTAVLILQQTTVFRPTPTTHLPIYYDEWEPKALDCAFSRKLPQSCFDLLKYEPVFGCAEQGPASVSAQTTSTGVGEGGAGGEVSPSKALAGGRDAVATATWCCVFTDVTEVQNRVKNTIT
jgi:hypothetical protein